MKATVSETKEESDEEEVMEPVEEDPENDEDGDDASGNEEKDYDEASGEDEAADNNEVSENDNDDGQQEEEEDGDGPNDEGKDAEGGDKSEFFEQEAEQEGEGHEDEKGADDNDEDEHGDFIRDEDEDDEDSEPRSSRKRKHRRHAIELDDDDYDLIQENTGKKITRNIDEDIEDDEDEDGEQPHKKMRRLKKARKSRANQIVATDGKELEEFLFEDDEVKSDLDDKVVVDRKEDLMDVEGEDFYDEDDLDDGFVEGDYVTGGEQMARLADLFGPLVEKFMNNPSNPVEDVRQVREQINVKDLVDPSERDVNFMRERDKDIRRHDIPERLQERIYLRGTQKQPKESDLRAEAKWIIKHAFNDNADLKIVVQVLHFIKIEYLEIPVIVNTRREYCDIPEENLWMIDEWDERWDRMHRRRSILLQKANDGIHDELIPFLKNTWHPEELNDVHEYLATLSHKEHKRIGEKIPRRIQLVNLIRDTGMDDLIQELSLTPQAFAENLKYKYPKNKFLKSPSEFPKDAAELYISHKLPDTEAVLVRARRIASFRLFLHPLVRSYIRSEFWSQAIVSTEPTAKGRHSITWTHPYYPIHRLKKKPVGKFEGEQFALICKAEKEKLITVTIEAMNTRADITNSELIPNDDFLLNECCDLFYGDDNKGEHSQAWNQERRRMLWEMLSRQAYPLGIAHVREVLLQKAQEAIANAAASKLAHHLETGNVGNARLISCCAGDRNEASVFAALDPNGMVIDHIELEHLKMRVKTRFAGKGSIELQRRKMDDVKRFLDFVERHMPKMILVSADSIESRSFKKFIQEKLFERNTQIQCYFVNPEVARIFSKSERSNVEFKEIKTLTRQAIAVGRWVLDPVAELASMMTINPTTKERDIFSLSLHPLQKEIPANVLMSALTRQMVRYVCHYGVDINDTLRNPHKRHQLPFVCGLGPRKAQQLYSDLKRTGPLQSRSALSPDKMEDEEDEDMNSVSFLGPGVYHNCASFLRITMSQDLPEDVELDPLDRTRIHPEDYTLARDIVRNVVRPEDEDQDEDEDDEVAAEDIEALTDPRYYNQLEALDLVAWADIIEQEQEGDDEAYAKKIFRLLLIKSELMRPFNDMRAEGEPHKIFGMKGRRPIEEPENTELFYILTGETPHTIKEGILVTARYTRIFTPRREQHFPRMNVVLENGLAGQVFLEDITDRSGGQYNHPGEALDWLREYVSPNMIMKGRIKKILYEHFSVVLSTKESEVDTASEERYEEQALRDLNDPYLKPLDPQERKEIERRDRIDRKKKTFKPRNIGHPLFKNVGREDAQDYLRNSRTERVVIRPSSKGTSNLTITFKLAKEGNNQISPIFIHWDIEELQKPDPMSIGEVLKCQGRKYEELDEIIARFVEPIEKKYREVIAHPKFWERVSRGASLDDLLKDEKKMAPMRIPYRICFSETHVGYVQIVYVPNRRTRKEYITVRPDGFQLRKKQFSKIGRLIDWFKKNFHRQPNERNRNVKREGKNRPFRKKLGVYKKGQEVSAMWSDRKWYAAEIIKPAQNQPGFYLVKYLEYGDELTIPDADIRPHNYDRRRPMKRE